MLALTLISSAASAVTVQLSAKTEGGDKPVVVGKTNLPPGTKLMVTVSRKESSFSAQTSPTVSEDGTFRSEQFSQRGSPFNPGVYQLEIITPMAAVQPAATKEFMGADGAKLQGPLVTRSVLSGKIITYKTKFSVAGGAGSAKADQATRIEDKAARHAWWLQSCKGICTVTASASASTPEPYGKCYARCLSKEPKKK
jgi:hypothetical protein